MSMVTGIASGTGADAQGQDHDAGRMMAGSQAVIAHDEAAKPLFVASDPPDIHLSQVIVASCSRWQRPLGAPALSSTGP